jgi:hypothetical protein
MQPLRACISNCKPTALCGYRAMSGTIRTLAFTRLQPLPAGPLPWARTVLHAELQPSRAQLAASVSRRTAASATPTHGGIALQQSDSGAQQDSTALPRVVLKGGKSKLFTDQQSPIVYSGAIDR